MVDSGQCDLFPTYQGDVANMPHDENGDVLFLLKAQPQIISISRTVFTWFGGRYPLMDLVHECNLAVWLSARSFDPEKGELGPFVAKVARNAIWRYLTNNARSVKLPSSVVGGIKRLTEVTYDFWQQYGREPDLYELAYAMGLPPQKVLSLLHAKDSFNGLSLDEPIGDDGVVGDFVRGSCGAEEIFFKDWKEEQLRKALGKLDDTSRVVIELTFYEGKKVAEIAEELNMSVREVRQTRDKALDKLRNMLTGIYR